MALAARRKKRSFFGPLGWLLLAVFVGGFAWLALTGREIPFVGRVVQAAGKGPPAGRIAVPTSSRSIDAYEAVSKNDVWDPVEGTLSVAYLSPETVEARGVLTSLGSILGRVLAKEKTRGTAFTEADFLPEGVRPGISAGIPPGKRGLRIDPEKIAGLAGLRAGDHFDLVATLSFEMPTSAGSLSGPWAVEARRQWELGRAVPQARVRMIVEDGVIVSPLTTRNVTFTANTLTQGEVQRNRTVTEMVIAIDPSEVAALTEQLAIEAEISCFPRSSHPEESEAGATPEPAADMISGGGWDEGWSSGGPFDPLRSGRNLELRYVERLDGTDRMLLPVPAGDVARGDEGEGGG